MIQDPKLNFVVPNCFNQGGYRYFCGIELLELVADGSSTGLAHSAFFFESYFPFDGLFREVLAAMIHQIRLQRIVVYQKYCLNCSDFTSTEDYVVFGFPITCAYILGQLKSDSMLEKFFHADVFGGALLLETAVAPVRFEPDLELVEFKHSLEALQQIPDYISLDLLLRVLGAVLQETVVVLHCHSRKVSYSVTSFVLSLIAPLVWTYPVIPVLKGQMKEFVDSPVPLICSVEESQEVFFQEWQAGHERNPNSVHFQLDSGHVIGTPAVDFISSVIKHDSNYLYNECVSLRNSFRSHEVVYMNQLSQYFQSSNQPSPNPTENQLTLLKRIKKVINTLYVDPVNTTELRLDTSKQFTSSLAAIKKRSKYPSKVTDSFLNGQIYLCYLERLKAASVSKNSFDSFFLA